MNKKNIKNKKAIFVDYFDTLVFRKINPSDVAYRWAYVLKNKYEELEDLTIEQIVNIRKQVTYDLKDEYEEVPYDILVKEIHKRLDIKENLKIFIDNCYEIEIAIELATQYINKKMYKLLLKEKRKGKKIYLISDFYLDSKAYEIFFKKLKIEDLFDEIFISGELNKTKRRHDDGLLYQYALEKLNLKKEDVIVIGDNKYSDYEVVKKIGIDSILYKNYKGNKKDYLAYSNEFLKNKDKEWKKGIYIEYVYVFYVLIHRLYKEATNDNVRKLAFLSREGLFIKRMFDLYQEFKVPNSRKIETFYVYNSRKLNKQLEDGNKEEYLEYLKQYFDGEYFNIVDSGWNNSAQECISRYVDVKVRGYYYGTFSKNKLDYECKRKGLIYDIDEAGKVSDYYWSLRTNFTLIEQLLAANHGSVESYNDRKFEFKWVDKEKQYYEKYIKNIQRELVKEFKQICIWSNSKLDNISNKKLARRTVKSGLFANKKRVDFLRDSDEAYYDNFSNNQFKGNFKSKKKTIKEKLFYPELKLSLLVKKQRRLKDNWFLNKVYFVWAFGLYIYLIILKKI